MNRPWYYVGSVKFHKIPSVGLCDCNHFSLRCLNPEPWPAGRLVPSGCFLDEPASPPRRYAGFCLLVCAWPLLLLLLLLCYFCSPRFNHPQSFSEEEVTGRPDRAFNSLSPNTKIIQQQNNTGNTWRKENNRRTERKMFTKWWAVTLGSSCWWKKETLWHREGGREEEE